MGTTATVVLIVAAVIALALVLGAAASSRSRRRHAVVDRFGPEYERAVDIHGDRRAAEHDLLDRARRRDELTIRPLDDDTRLRYADTWHAVQSAFVDQPQQAMVAADRLLRDVMHDRGYPVDDPDRTADLISVDHPVMVERYRSARSLAASTRTRAATTDELRRAVLDYRALFDELLRDRDTAPAQAVDVTAGRTEEGRR